MDLPFIQKAWGTFMSDPAMFLFMLAIGAVGAWWFRGHTMKQELKVADRHLAYAREKEKDLTDKLQRVEKNMLVLQQQFKMGAGLDVLSTTTAATSVMVSDAVAANTALQVSLNSPTGGGYSGIDLIRSPKD